MRITQGYVSKSVSDFAFLEALQVTDYVDSEKPCIFLGCYDDKDMNVMENHKGGGVLHWMGQDAIDAVFYAKYLRLKHLKHVTFHENIYKVLSPFLEVEYIKPWTVNGNFHTVTPLGKCIYVYAPSSALEYHNIDLIRKLQDYFIGFEFFISDGSVSQSIWNERIGPAHYDRCFIGLVLNGFAGGANTIIQLGLKGRMVVNNVLKLPNSIPFQNIEDVKTAIDNQVKYVGFVRNKVAEATREALSSDKSFLNID